MEKNNLVLIEEIFTPDVKALRRKQAVHLATKIMGAGLSTAWQLASERLNAVHGMFVLPLADVEEAYIDAVLAIVDLDKFKIGANDSPRAEAAMVFESDLLAAALGIDSEVTCYSLSEFRDALFYDFSSLSLARYLMTCREVIKGMEPTKYGNILLLLLRSPALQNAQTFSRESLALIVGALFSITANFDRFTTNEQKEILNNYFFRGYVVGVPFESIFTNRLLSSVGFFDYISRLAVYIDGIAANNEDVSGDGLLFGKLFVDFYDKKNRKIVTTPADFIQHLKTKLTPNKTARIIELLILATQLKIANLVTWEEVMRHQAQSDEYRITEELTKLFEFFLIQSDWKKFVNYYRQPNPLIPLKSFFKRCQMGLDIKSATVPERMLLFVDFLKNEKILKEGDDIIIFDESDNQFHWNEPLLA